MGDAFIWGMLAGAVYAIGRLIEDVTGSQRAAGIFVLGVVAYGIWRWSTSGGEPPPTPAELATYNDGAFPMADVRSDALDNIDFMVGRHSDCSGAAIDGEFFVFCPSDPFDADAGYLFAVRGSNRIDYTIFAVNVEARAKAKSVGATGIMKIGPQTLRVLPWPEHDTDVLAVIRRMSIAPPAP